MANSELGKLQKIWYKKLKQEGFNDIETCSTVGILPKGRGYPRQLKDMTATQINAVENYYSMARNFVHDNEFESDLEKIIWEHYSEGLSMRNISKQLSLIGITKKKDTIRLVVVKLEKIMKKLYKVDNA